MGIWVPIRNYEGIYEVSSEGEVRTSERALKAGVNGRGYLTVSLCKDGDKKTCPIHILVATHFVPNPNNLPIVHHKDEDKLNNTDSNLEWTTQQKNCRYSGHIQAKHVVLRDPSGKPHTIHNVSRFARKHGLNVGNLISVTNGKRKSCGGWTL